MWPDALHQYLVSVGCDGCWKRRNKHSWVGPQSSSSSSSSSSNNDDEAARDQKQFTHLKQQQYVQEASSVVCT